MLLRKNIVTSFKPLLIPNIQQFTNYLYNHCSTPMLTQEIVFKATTDDDESGEESDDESDDIENEEEDEANLFPACVYFTKKYN